MSHRARTTPTRLAAAALVALAAVAGLGATSAGAASSAATKTVLTQTNRDCGGVVIGAVETIPFGHSVVIRPASNKVQASVTLRGARPSTAYDIRLIQLLPDGSDCQGVGGTLTTDANGDGKASVSEPLLSGALGAWVDLNAADDFTNFYDSAPTWW